MAVRKIIDAAKSSGVFIFFLQNSFIRRMSGSDIRGNPAEENERQTLDLARNFSKHVRISGRFGRNFGVGPPFLIYTRLGESAASRQVVISKAVKN